MPAMLEHTNFTVSDPNATAAWMEKLFGWETRWKGDARGTGYTVHVGTKDHYLALYHPGSAVRPGVDNYTTAGGLNHIAVVVQDLDVMEKRIQAHGFETGEHYDYEPGRRFYFYDDNGIEFEVVAYD